jgi:hypothetical protein
MADGGRPRRGPIAPAQAVLPPRPTVAAVLDTASNAPSVRAESAESPHCIALQMATVRYSVEEKPGVTCDNAKMSWSQKHRYLLCKQGVAGSSPVVSTANVLVRSLLDRLAVLISHCPCPLRAHAVGRPDGRPTSD